MNAKQIAERDRLIDELRDAEARNAQKLSEIARLREALSGIADVLSEWLKDAGGCDHDVGICCCREQRLLESARAALENGDE